MSKPKIWYSREAGCWVARNLEYGICSQGPTITQALRAIKETTELYKNTYERMGLPVPRLVERQPVAE